MTTRADPRALLVQRYAELAPRERALVAVMGVAVAFLVVWLIAVRPAWNTLASAPRQRELADAQLLQMQAIASEAKQLRALPPISQSQAEQALKSATDQLNGKGKLTLQGERATLALSSASGEELRQWLLQARSGAHARPIEAALTRAGDGYNGTLVVAIGTSR